MRVLLVAASLLLTGLVGLAVAPSASAVGDCIGEPGAVQVCQNLMHPAFRHCVSVGVGFQGASACHGVGGTAVCTSAHTNPCITVD